MLNPKYNTMIYHNNVRYPQTKGGLYRNFTVLPPPKLKPYNHVPSFSNMMLDGTINMDFRGQVYRVVNPK